MLMLNIARPLHKLHLASMSEIRVARISAILAVATMATQEAFMEATMEANTCKMPVVNTCKMLEDSTEETQGSLLQVTRVANILATIPN